MQRVNNETAEFEGIILSKSFQTVEADPLALPYRVLAGLVGLFTTIDPPPRLHHLTPSSPDKVANSSHSNFSQSRDVFNKIVPNSDNKTWSEPHGKFTGSNSDLNLVLDLRGGRVLLLGQLE